MAEHVARATEATAEDLASAMVAQARDHALIALDQHGVVTTWNAGAHEVKGYTAEEIVGRHFSVFYPEEDRRAGLPARGPIRTATLSALR